MVKAARPAGNESLAHPLWIDLVNPTPEEMGEVAERFGFHPLSVEDALDPRNQRPKLDRYDTYRYLAFYAFEAPVTRDSAAGALEINLFWGEDYIVTVRHEPVPALDEARRRWEEREYSGATATIALLHTILDAAVDSSLPVIDTISERLEALEDEVFTGTHPLIAVRGQHLRRELLALRRILLPERDIVVALSRDPWIADHPELARYFDDVYDHVTRAAESVDTEREIVTGVLETYLSAVSNNLNEVMKVLTVAATILMTMSLVAGVYGMNFRHMPELGWRAGYPLALILMAASAGGLIYYFHRRRWI